MSKSGVFGSQNGQISGFSGSGTINWWFSGSGTHKLVVFGGLVQKLVYFGVLSQKWSHSGFCPEMVTYGVWSRNRPNTGLVQKSTKYGFGPEYTKYGFGPEYTKYGVLVQNTPNTGFWSRNRPNAGMGTQVHAHAGCPKGCASSLWCMCRVHRASVPLLS